MFWNRLRALLDPDGDGNLRDIISNMGRAALNPATAQVMARKFYRRYWDRPGQITAEQNLNWITANLQDFSAMARRIDRELWEETEEFGKRLRLRANEILGGEPIARAGGAFYPFLYFVTRQLAPECIIETGVAAGYSSRAFLEGISRNGKGRLFSTDFPLFRNHDPEHAIGILVEPHLKGSWELYTQGDELGLPAIVKKVAAVDVFHYDSDKTYAGRTFALRVVRPKFHPRSILLVDDIQDNSWFHDYVKQEQRSDFSTFEFGGKYIGLLGSLDERHRAGQFSSPK